MKGLFRRVRAIWRFRNEENMVGLIGAVLICVILGFILGGVSAKHTDYTYVQRSDRVVAVKIVEDTFYAKTSKSGVYARNKATFEGDSLKLWCRGNDCHQYRPLTPWSWQRAVIGVPIGVLVGVLVWLWIMSVSYKENLRAKLEDVPGMPA